MMALQFFFRHLLQHLFLAIQAPTIAPALTRVVATASRCRHRRSSLHDTTPASKRQRMGARDSWLTSLHYCGPCFRFGEEQFPSFLQFVPKAPKLVSLNS